MTNLRVLERMLAHRKPDESVIISKKSMQQVPQGCSETWLGDPDRAYKQYRCDHNIHILEYPDRYKVHKDRVDPRKDPIGHLIHDSPETLCAIGVAIMSGIIVGKRIYDNRKKTSENANGEAIIGGILTAILSGMATYYIGKGLKNM